MKLSAQKARNIQMLQIGEPNFIEERIVWASFNGKSSIMIPDNQMTTEQIEDISKSGYEMEYKRNIDEWEISWSN